MRAFPSGDHNFSLSCWLFGVFFMAIPPSSLRIMVFVTFSCQENKINEESGEKNGTHKTQLHCFLVSYSCCLYAKCINDDCQTRPKCNKHRKRNGCCARTHIILCAQFAKRSTKIYCDNAAKKKCLRDRTTCQFSMGFQRNGK